MRVSVIGAGYVGLVTAAGLSGLGHRVFVGEADPQRLASLQAGRVPFYEPGLTELVREGMGRGLLSFDGSNQNAVTGTSIVLVAVPTPPSNDGSASGEFVYRVAQELAPVITDDTVVVLKSTVPVGSGERVEAILRAGGSRAAVVSNPEFLREGFAVEDFFAPSRIVIGTEDEAAAKLLARLYEGLDAPLLVTDRTSAELIKYAANAYLATRISFANEIAGLCEATGADVGDVLAGVGLDPRIGLHYLSPGPGFGGSCLPKDTRALMATARELDHELLVIPAVMAMNDRQRDYVLTKIRTGVGGDLAGRTVAFWGLAFKAGSDDVRDSPALALARAVLAEGARVTAYDPAAAGVTDEIRRVEDPIEAAKEADVLVVATEWEEFGRIDPAAIAEAMAGDLVVDTRNLLDERAVRSSGLRYDRVGGAAHRS